ncbi:MAG TPA: hypothetical protein DCZ91_13845 [Lachnospiraceae bacterium]|nr:hypothetical protein [Lachnospiraceae bacterium]
MAYEAEEIRASQEIFYYLLEHHELGDESQERLFRGYAENERIQNLVKSQGEAAQCDIERYGDVIYLIPREDNAFLGFSKAQLKQLLCKSNGTDKDYYLSQFVILTLLVEFYDGQGATSKTRDYMRVGELQNCISARLREGAERSEEEGRFPKEEGRFPGQEDISREERQGIAFSNMMEAYEALRSDEKGSRAKTTKEGFLYNILNFLQKQGLIEYVEEDEMIKTTKKLDQFMDWNLLNQNHFQRVRRVLEENASEALRAGGE